MVAPTIVLTAREQLVEARKRVYVAKDEPGMQAMVVLLKLLVQANDLERRTCTPEALAGLQGETVAYTTVAKFIAQPITEGKA